MHKCAHEEVQSWKKDGVQQTWIQYFESSLLFTVLSDKSGNSALILVSVHSRHSFSLVYFSVYVMFTPVAHGPSAVFSASPFAERLAKATKKRNRL